MAKKEVRRPLKPRDIKFVKAKASNPDMPNYKAAMIATGATSVGVANVTAQRMLQNVSLREAIDEELARQGLTMEDVVTPVNEALSYYDNEDPKSALELRLKGHDRAVKLLQIAGGEQNQTNVTLNFNNTQKNYLKNN